MRMETCQDSTYDSGVHLLGGLRHHLGLGYPVWEIVRMNDNWHYHFMIDEAQIASLANHSHDMRDCGEGIYRCLLCTMELTLIETKGKLRE